MKKNKTIYLVYNVLLKIKSTQFQAAIIKYDQQSKFKYLKI